MIVSKGLWRTGIGGRAAGFGRDGGHPPCGSMLLLAKPFPPDDVPRRSRNVLLDDWLVEEQGFLPGNDHED
jgi:hypothetical protein